MNNRDDRFSFLAIPVLIAVLAGGIVGWATGSYMTQNAIENTETTSVVPGIGGGPEDNSQNQVQTAYSSTISNFRVKLNSLFKEHGVIATEYLTKLYDGQMEDSLRDQLDKNSSEIAANVGNVYGEEARSEFLEMWNGHIEQYEKYTNALKDENESDKSEAEQTLQKQAMDMGEMLNRLDNNFSAQRITDLVNEHVRLTLDIVNAHADENNAAVTRNMKLAFDQAGVFADYVGQIIINSHPDKVR